MHGDGTESALHWDAPIFDEEITVQLSGGTIIQGSVPVSQMIVAHDGLEQYLPWSTAVYAVEGERVLAGGIITELVVSDGKVTFIADGFSQYPSEQPYTGTFHIIEGDAAQIYRSMWNHIQGQDGGNLGLEIVGLQKSGLLLGEPEIPGYTEAQIDGKWHKASDPKIKRQIQPNVWGRLRQNLSKTGTSLRVQDPNRGNWRKRSFPFDLRIGSEIVRITGAQSGDPGLLFIGARGVSNTRATKHYKNTIVRSAGTKTREVKTIKAKPWQANWFTTPDVGREMSRLAADGGFEFLEETTLSGETFSHRIRLGKPLGTRRAGLRFMVGENVTRVPEIVFDTQRWASEVLVLGSGEGRTMKHATAARNHNRLRKVHLSTDKGAKHTYQVRELARRELNYRNGRSGVEELEVRNSPHAPFGSFAPGDEVFIQTDEQTGSMDMWVRVLSITYLTEEDMAVLSVIRV